VVARVDDSGNAIWVTEFGGEREDLSGSTAAFPGIVAFSGTTRSADLPVTANAPVSTLRSQADLFAASFDSATGELRNATYAGIDRTPSVVTTAADSGGDIAIGGGSNPGDSFLESDGFLLRWNAASNRFLFSRRFDAPVRKLVFDTGFRLYFTSSAPYGGRLVVGLLNATGEMVGSLVTVSAPDAPDSWISTKELLPLPDGDVWVVYSIEGYGARIAKVSPARGHVAVSRVIAKGGSYEGMGFTPGGNFKFLVRRMTPTEVTTDDAPLVAACPDTLYLAIVAPTGDLVHATYLPEAGYEFHSENEPSGPTQPALRCIANSAGRIPIRAAAPGQLITLTGGGFGPSTTRYYSPDATGRYPLVADGFRVRVSGRDAPIIALARGLIAVQVPYELETSISDHTIEVYDNGRPLNSLPLLAAIGYLSLFDTGEREARSNQPVLVALNQDGSVNTRTNPAAPGSTISLFGTGLGQLTPALRTGAISPAAPLSQTALLRASLSGEILYLGSAPGLSTSVAQVNLRLPAHASGSPGADGVVAVPIGVVVSDNVRSLLPLTNGVVYVK
jgi:uncharacterized protein (TIGR03437 family)